MPHHPMSEAEVRAFLTSEPPHTGKLATTRLDGRPHVAPIWFVVDDDGSIVFTTFEESLKGRTLRRDPRAALCVDDEVPPFSFVTVEGEVEISEDVEELRRWATIIGGRYMGAESAEAYGARNGVSGELLCRLRPTRIVSAKDVAD
jgi:PPOX class probable F420-dependent enzyme